MMITTFLVQKFRTAVTPRVVFLDWPIARAAAVVAAILMLVWLNGPAAAELVLESREDEPGWRSEAAAKYLDERATGWFAFDSRGEGATRSTCISCHTVLPYILARPALRKLTGSPAPTEPEAKLLAQTKMRVAHWKDLDTKPFGLFYDSSEEKEQESWGTEAVFNAAVLAFDDRYQGKSTPSEATRQAFANLWATQLRSGDHKGTWAWLDFNEAPWGIGEARYFGAALAAIAVGTAPGYYVPDADADTEARVQSLQEYLTREAPRQDLHNQAWALWAAAKAEGILTAAEMQHLIAQLLDKQRDDGGWSLPSLGTWRRNDGTSQEAVSDGYASGLVLHVLQTAGLPKSDARVAKGLRWLRNNQSPAGAWHCASLVKKRDPDSHTGKFMSDAATAFAVLALSH
jgi:squalene-hopene/tetraprenyl-beta-curcumene cyclase